MRYLIVAALMGGASTFCVHARAQDRDLAEATVDAPQAESEIVVVAQKRSESIQKVPISITAIDDHKLEAANITSAYDLGRVATNISVQRAAQASNVRLTIRGIGAPGNTATEPSVATFLDGSYIPRPGAVVASFLDIEGVEVLRGPQGTLFGRNAGVGALSLRSVVPVDRVEGAVTGEYGNAGRVMVRGVANAPIGDGVALRVAAQQRSSDGFWTNRLDGQRYGASDETAMRVNGRFNRGDVDLIVRADVSRMKGDGLANIDLDPRSISPAQLAALEARFGSAPDTNLVDRTSNQVQVGQLRDKQWGLSSQLDWSIGDYSLRFVNNYREWRNDQTDGDVLYLPLQALTRHMQYRSNSHNHDLQLVSPTDVILGGAVDFVAGLYYFAEDFRIGEQLQQESQFCNALVPPAQRPACNTMLAAGLGVDATNLAFRQKLDSYAGYAQMNVHLSDALTAVIGGRYTKEKKNGRFTQSIRNPFAAVRAPEDVPLALDDDRFTYRLGLNYEAGRDILLFASYSTGFKSGGFNSGGGTPALGLSRIFEAETVRNYEAGLKSQWLDRALTFNATFYRMDIEGYQDRSFDGTSFIVRNAGNLRHQGAEIELSARPSSYLTAGLALAYLDSRFTDYRGASGLPGVGGVQDLTDGRAHYAPEWSGNAHVEWRQEVGGLLLAINGSVNFISDQNIGGVTDNNPQTVQDGYALTNMRVTFSTADERLSLSLYGNNIFDVYYASAAFYQPLDAPLGLRNGVFHGSTAVRPVHGEPRTYGISASYRF